MNRRHVMPVGVMLLVTALVLTACGSSGKTASSSTTTAAQSSTSGTQAAPTGAPITVGVICTCSGPQGAYLEDGAKVYQAWADSVNASGGINGHPVQVTVEDDTGTPGTAITVAKDLISKKVDAIVDNSVLGVLWGTTVAPSGIPVVGSNETDSPFDTSPDFYPQGGTIASAITSYVLTAKASGAQSLGYLYSAEAPQCAQIVAPLKTAGQANGVPETYNTEIAATAPNYTAQCVAAQQGNVQALFIGSSPAIVDRVAADCQQQNYTPDYVLPGQDFAGVFLTAPGIKTKSAYPFVVRPYWDNFAGSQAMNTALDKYYPGLRKDANLFTQTAADAWPAGLLLEDAVKAGGLTASATPSANEVVSGLTSLNGDTLQGWTPAPLSFAAGKTHSVNCWFEGQVVNGTPSLLNNSQPTCENS